MKQYWRDKRVILWSFAAGVVWLGAGIIFYLQQGSLVLALFWGLLALPWIVKGVYDLKVPYIELHENEFVVRRSIISKKRIFPLAGIEGITRVERKEFEFIFNAEGQRNAVVILVNELNGKEISRFANDLKEKIKAKAQKNLGSDKKQKKIPKKVPKKQVDH